MGSEKAGGYDEYVHFSVPEKGTDAVLDARGGRPAQDFDTR